jgi:FkbM family methyltransferase
MTAKPRKRAPQRRSTQLSVSQAKKQTRRQPNNDRAWHALGVAHMQQQQIDEAQLAFEKAAEIAPSCGDHQEWLGYIGYRRRENDVALVHLDQAEQIKPDSVFALTTLARIYLDRSNPGQAYGYLQRAYELTPNNSEVNELLCQALHQNRDFDEAIELGEKLVEAEPENYHHWNNLGNIYRDLALITEANRCYQRAAELNNADPIPFSNWLTALHYDPRANRSTITQLAREWQSRFAPSSPPSRPVPSDRRPDKRLRIGMLSDGFRQHPVGKMIIRCLENLDSAEVELFAYTSNDARDVLTGRIRALCQQWQPVQHLSDDALAQRIRDDAIDIFIDLSGHNTGSRMRAAAMQPAPLLVKWVGGLINTTGVEAIDYLISDAIETPHGEDAFYSEKLIRMPNDYIVFDPPQNAPDVAELPASRNGYVTLGCFNNPCKLNDVVLGEWAAILHALPDAKLMLKGQAYKHQGFCDRVCAVFESKGIARERLILEGPASNREILAAYNRVDIALDPWPYSGGLTTCESFLMGVPVVTLPGPTFAGRHSATHLVNAGMSELIVDSWDAYRARVIELANDLDNLAIIRRLLRDVLLRSPVCDGKRFAHHFTVAMRAIWQRYCEEQPPAALTIDNEGQAQFADRNDVETLRHPAPEPGDGFRWEFQGKVIAIDNGGASLTRPSVLQMIEQQALELVVFDPASRLLKSTSQENDAVHYYPNVSLGNGQSETLHVCLDPDFSSTLAPLADLEASGGNDSQKIIAKLPINTISLDTIQGLPNVDWVILDELNDAISILDNGRERLSDALLIQARVVFQPTHDHQPSLAVLQSWADRHGWRLYCLHRSNHRSRLPAHLGGAHRTASELVSADAILLPGQHRVANLDHNRRIQLAFLLHTVYGLHDLVHEILGVGDPAQAQHYFQDYIADAASTARSQTPPTGQRKTVYGSSVALRQTETAATVDDLWTLTSPIQVVDIGANPIDGTPPYAALLARGLAKLTGFEPQPEALARLKANQGPYETYLPHAVGNGDAASLYLCHAPGMTSTLKPNSAVLDHFHHYPTWARVKQKATVQTVRLDDIEEITGIDWLKIDIQGGELTVFTHGERQLKNALVIQTEVNFVALYEDQPLFSDLDQWLRARGFMLHTLLEQRRRLFQPLTVGGVAGQGINQLTTADAVYIRDINNLDTLEPERVRKLAFILHEAYGSYDLSLRLLQQLDARYCEPYLSALPGSLPLQISTQSEETPIARDPVFVIGCGHTGTTLMAQMLGAHPCIHTIKRETGWFIDNTEFEREFNVERNCSATAGKTLICEKTPRHVHRADQIRARFTGARFIVMTREPTDVVASLKNRIGEFEPAVQRWLADSQASLNALEHADALQVRYEDLVVNPQAELERICEFLGLPYDARMLDYHQDEKTWFGVAPASTDGRGEKNHLARRAWQMTQPITDRRGIWKEHLSTHEAELVADRTQAVARALGY